MEKLNFNEMLNKCWETALGMTKVAKLYQGSSPHDLSFIHCIFRGNDEYATILKIQTACIVLGTAVWYWC